jgi:hypothetical protein
MYATCGVWVHLMGRGEHMTNDPSSILHLHLVMNERELEIMIGVLQAQIINSNNDEEIQSLKSIVEQIA